MDGTPGSDICGIPVGQPVPPHGKRYCLVNVAVRLIGAVRVLRTGLRLFGVRALLAALLLIQLAEDGVYLLGEGIHRVLDFFRVVAFAHLLEVRDFALDGRLVFRGQLVAVLAQLLLHLVNHGVSMVEGFDFFLALLVLLSVLLSFLDALVDFFLGQVGGSGDGNLLLVASRLILAETFTMPFASMEKVTSICGTPRGAGAIPVSWKRPKDLLS